MGEDLFSRVFNYVFFFVFVFFVVVVVVFYLIAKNAKLSTNKLSAG